MTADDKTAHGWTGEKTLRSEGQSAGQNAQGSAGVRGRLLTADIFGGILNTEKNKIRTEVFLLWHISLQTSA